MSRETIERCDCCGREVPLLGCRGKKDDYYRDVYRRDRWTFNLRRFWHIAERDRVTVCGECWERIGKEVNADLQLSQL